VLPGALPAGAPAPGTSAVEARRAAVRRRFLVQLGGGAVVLVALVVLSVLRLSQEGLL
jgi:Tfp pilus assembly protein PilN